MAGIITNIGSFLKAQTFVLARQLENLISKFSEKKTKLFGSKAYESYFCDPIDPKGRTVGRFVYRLGQPPFTGQRRVRFPYRLQSLSCK